MGKGVGRGSGAVLIPPKTISSGTNEYEVGRGDTPGPRERRHSDSFFGVFSCISLPGTARAITYPVRSPAKKTLDLTCIFCQ